MFLSAKKYMPVNLPAIENKEDNMFSCIITFVKFITSKDL